ncbi:germinal-center associated nuclear protein-like [Acanthaster planci]|uniref:Germinal-center associated nuclear protein-like n=1 Tax=Acanthaster planci TaxID=133434 RepID=A0A8B7XU34_ACAPL|nr:germinal-center associated nuclear protein-like [Acanthaster planci]
MSSRSYYNQKKKKEALRRLSQSGARGVKSPRDAVPDDPLRQERGTRRHQRRSMEEDDHHSAGGIFGGRRVIATDSPLSGTHLVIQANVGGQSSGADTPDTEPDQPRRVVTSQPTSVPQGPFKLFGKSAGVSSSPPSDKTLPGGGVSSGIFNSPQKSAEESEAPGSEKQYQASPTRRSVFQAETSNFFPIRPLSGNASADDLQTSHKGTNSAGSLSAQDSTANPFAKRPQEVSLHSSATEVPESLFRSKEASPGVDSVTRNLFGKPAPKSTESSSLLFGKSAPKPEILFGKEVSRELEFKPQGKVLFGKVIELSSRRDHGDVPAKRQLSPSRSEAASKRTLMAFNDPFSSTSSDITDLETFGADTSKKDARQKKPLIKRSGLFGKAIAEASGRSHDSPRGDQPSDSHALTSKTHKSRSRSPEKRKQSPGRSSEDEIKKTRDESKPGRRSSSSSSSSRRFASPEEIKKLQAIVIKGVPPVANSRAYLKDFFSQYGPVTRVFTNAAKHSAIVYFADHDSAAYAKKKARVLKRGTKPVAIFWRQGDPGPKSENRPSQDDHKVSSTKHTESKQIGVRPSLAMFNRKIEAKVNPEDGSSVVKQISSTTSAAGHQKTTNLSVPGHLLSKQVGHTAQDRYDILEDRDRVIRQGLKKKTNLAMPGAIKGTCPDMCPEKERYMREVQRRLHPYEVLQGSTDQVHVNHDAAVKEYSRSSADQEEPLPHEMRPAPVLTMTMNYLMRHVMNTGQDGHWEEWFDFLWSRTRGIRKDITQQDLRDLTAIDLMEKCARFHIFCSHRLCEEDLSTIDPKINNENLTKCMQSLKQFYRDLASEGVVCPNEAEFRAYDVLLNLNDRDILR